MNCVVGCGFGTIINSTNFTCWQLIDYCNRYEQWMPLERAIKLGIFRAQLTSGIFGFISYIFIQIVFRASEFKGASFIYHKSMGYMEFLHMAVLIQGGIMEPFVLDKIFPDTYIFVIYRDLCRRCWAFGDAVKLSVSVITVFLSLERFVAIWFPTYFHKINNPRLCWALTGVGVVVGWAHFLPMLTFDIVPLTANQTYLYKQMPKAVGSSYIGGEQAISQVLYFFKIGAAVCIMLLSVGVATGLVLKAKKAESMNQNAKNKWAETRRLCLLQITMAVVLVIDHILWVGTNIMRDNQPLPMLFGAPAVVSNVYDYNRAIRTIDYQYLWQALRAAQTSTGSLDHAFRLAVYLLTMHKFRQHFCNLFQKIRAGASVGSFSMTQTTVTMIKVKPASTING